MGALPDLQQIRAHCEQHYHFRPGGFYVHPDDQDVRYRHASAHNGGEVKDGHTHANPMKPFAENSKPTETVRGPQMTVMLPFGEMRLSDDGHSLEFNLSTSSGLTAERFTVEEPEGIGQPDIRIRIRCRPFPHPEDDNRVWCGVLDRWVSAEHAKEHS